MNPSPSTKRSRGVLGVELAIIIPMLVLIFFGGLEFAHSLRIYEALTSINRQLNVRLFRGCLASLTPQTCIDNEIASVVSNTTLTLQGVRVMGSRWEYSLGACTMTHFGAGGAPIPGYATPRVTASLPEMLQSCQDQGVMYFGEVMVVYNPIIPAISSLLGVPSNGVYYVALGI